MDRSQAPSSRAIHEVNYRLAHSFENGKYWFASDLMFMMNNHCTGRFTQRRKGNAKAQRRLCDLVYSLRLCVKLPKNVQWGGSV